MLSANTTLYYRLNVTVFDDNIKIACRPNITGIGEYVYHLTVLCKYYYSIQCKLTLLTDPPMKTYSRQRIRGQVGEEITVNCPLAGNPLPVCTWEFYTCSYTTLLEAPSGITYKNNNCSLIINDLTSEYLYKCFKCNARNSLGSNSRDVQSIFFTGIIIMHGKEAHMHTIYLGYQFFNISTVLFRMFIKGIYFLT